MSKPKAVGSRGSWFADVLGEKLPCVSDHHLSRRHYLDPGAKPGTTKWDNYISAIQHGGRIVLTHTELRPDGRTKRNGYVALFSVVNVKTSAHGLEFDLEQRLLNLA